MAFAVDLLSALSLLTHKLLDLGLVAVSYKDPKPITTKPAVSSFSRSAPFVKLLLPVLNERDGTDNDAFADTVVSLSTAQPTLIAGLHKVIVLLSARLEATHSAGYTPARSFAASCRDPSHRLGYSLSLPSCANP